VFRKRKDSSEVQGFNRISRLIEDRQRELAESGTAEGELDDEILLSATATEKGGGTSAGTSGEAEEEAVSLLGLRGPSGPAAYDDGGADSDSFLHDAASAAETPGNRSPTGHDAETTEQPGTYAPAAWQSAAPRASEAQSAAMRVPDLGATATSGTLVAVEAEWEGKLRSQGNIRVEGVVRGEIETAMTLVVAPQARVHGTVRARNITLGGDVEGDITCDERLEILPGGSARGQINSATLVVHEGAYIDSRFQMRREPESGA